MFRISIRRTKSFANAIYLSFSQLIPVVHPNVVCTVCRCSDLSLDFPDVDRLLRPTRPSSRGPRRRPRGHNRPRPLRGGGRRWPHHLTRGHLPRGGRRRDRLIWFWRRRCCCCASLLSALSGLRGKRSALLLGELLLLLLLRAPLLLLL